MVKKRKLKKAIFIALVLLSVASLFLISFHHHEAQDQGTHDCSVCLFAHATAYVLVFFMGLGLVSLFRTFFRPRFKSFSSLLVSSGLQGRAPPLFS